MDRRSKWTVGVLGTVGIPKKVGTNVVTVMEQDGDGMVTKCKGLIAALPVNADKGFAMGCQFIDLTHSVIYTNTGSATSASFAAYTGGSVSSASMAANAVVASKIASSAVTASKIADTSIAAGKIASNAVIAGKLKHATVMASVASNTGSLSVATSASAEIIGWLPALLVAGASGLRVTKVVKSAASTAKVSLSGATSHTGAAVISLITLKAS